MGWVIPTHEDLEKPDECQLPPFMLVCFLSGSECGFLGDELGPHTEGICCGDLAGKEDLSCH